MQLLKAINLSIDHLLAEGLTDTILQYPKELDDLKDPKIRTELETLVKEAIDGTKTCTPADDLPLDIDCFKKLGLNRISYALLPKKVKFDYRRCAIIEPVDLAKYLAIVLLLAEEIEKARIPREQKKVFSYRLSVKGHVLFDNKYHYGSFLKTFKDKLKDENNKVIVLCDISNFYERLNLHRLEAILLSLKVEKKVVRMLNEMLLSWAERNSYGLPIGNNASRILAEASLIEVDKFLISHDVDFIRFVDDYRIFAPDGKTAHYWLSLLVKRLAMEGLMINQNKTDIRENFLLLKVEDEESETLPAGIEQLSEVFDDLVETYEGAGGYQGDVPLRYLQIPEVQKEEIRKKNESELFARMKSSLLINPKDFVGFCKIIEVKKKYVFAREIPYLLEKFPQFTPYAVDFILSISDDLTDEIANDIRDNFISNWIAAKHTLPEYILAALYRLFSNQRFLSKSTLMKCFRTLSPSDDLYISRTLLECLEKIVDRGEFKEIQQYYSKASTWEKRQIILMARRHLAAGELRAMYKTIKADSNEPLIGLMVKKKVV